MHWLQSQGLQNYMYYQLNYTEYKIIVCIFIYLFLQKLFCGIIFLEVHYLLLVTKA